MTDGAVPARLPFRRLLMVLGVVATLYAAALLIWGDSPRDSMAALWSWAGLQAGSLCLLNYLLRGLRWRGWMARYGRPLPLREGLRFYLAGYAFTPTPGNVGEAVRGMMLADKPLSTAQSLAIFGAERLADLLCLLLLCLPALWWLAGQGKLFISTRAFILIGAAVLVAVAAVALLLYRYGGVLLRRFPWLREALACLTEQPWRWLCLTLAAWMSQGFGVWILCRAMGVELDSAIATGFYALAMVAGALSALPAGLGGMEAAMTGLLVAHGAVPAVAVGLTVIVRLLTLWLAVGIGVAALLYSAAIRKDMKL